MKRTDLISYLIDSCCTKKECSSEKFEIYVNHLNGKRCAVRHTETLEAKYVIHICLALKIEVPEQILR